MKKYSVHFNSKSTTMIKLSSSYISILNKGLCRAKHVDMVKSYLLTLPLCTGVSRMDWVSCAGDINLPHTPFPPARSPPQQKFSTHEKNQVQ